MTYNKNTLTFTNSKLDNFVIRDGEHYVQSDYKAVERAMRLEAIRYITRKSLRHLAASFEATRESLNKYGV